ncbi:MAG: metal-dependent transcriptional regulator [Bacilli bacterium]|nr:metal-dependent transcriptional regulator [Bacilli bacterium]
MKIYESGEDYLERILIIRDRGVPVHAVLIAKELHISRPSVSIMLKKLEKNGFIIINDKDELLLTEEGEKVAKKIYERHQVLTSLFIALGIEPEVAQKDACKVEHDLSDEVFEKIKEIYKTKYQK